MERRMAEILDPVAEASDEVKSLAPLLPDIRGKTVGFRIEWPNFQLFMSRIEELLRERYEPSAVISLNEIAAKKGLPNLLAVSGTGWKVGRSGKLHLLYETLDEFAAKSDWAVIGLGG